MAKVDIFSGFFGAGKTTLIKKLIAEGYDTKNIVLMAMIQKTSYSSRTSLVKSE